MLSRRRRISVDSFPDSTLVITVMFLRELSLNFIKFFYSFSSLYLVSTHELRSLRLLLQGEGSVGGGVREVELLE